MILFCIYPYSHYNFATFSLFISNFEEFLKKLDFFYDFIIFDNFVLFLFIFIFHIIFEFLTSKVSQPGSNVTYILVITTGIFLVIFQSKSYLSLSK
jgi:hypothetical protein